MQKFNTPKIVLIATALTLLMMLLFPPFKHVSNGMVINKGHAFILHPPVKRMATIDYRTLAVQCLIVSAVGAIFYFGTKRKD